MMSQSQHAPTLPAEDEVTNRLPLARKLVLFFMFCCAHFLDTFNNAALVSAIPTLMSSMGIAGSRSAWIISAYQLTFASFLLISGRISDVYNTKRVFFTGLSFLGILSVVAGFMNNKIAIIVLRALMGVASAMTIPSALALLVRVFPDPVEQARAIAVQGGCGAVGDVLGLFIGAILVQYASYHWVFWFTAIVAIPVSLACLFLIPPFAEKSKDGSDVQSANWKRLDLIGVFTLTVAFVLFIYAVTNGSVDGWATAGVLIPLIVSILLISGFLYWETLIPPERAAIPPRTWFYNNFAVLFGLALLPFFWWDSFFFSFTTLWQDVFHWTVISTAAHMFPIGVAAFLMGFAGPLSRIVEPKWLILTGLLMTSVSTAIVSVGGGQPQDYWRYVLPALCLGSAGTMLTYTHTNIAIFQAAPASMAGTVGAIFNGALQFGSAIGFTAFCSIKASVEASHGGPQQYHGRTAAFWFLLGIVLVEILSVSVFYRQRTDHQTQSKSGTDTAVDGGSREKGRGYE